MNRFQRVTEILDEAVGGPTAPVGSHHAFWRAISRDDFVVHKVFGLPLLVVGDGASSNLVKALKGEAPFGADLDVPPPGAEYYRMPAWLDPVPSADIAFIQTWIDEGCLEDEIAPMAVAAPSWRPMASAPTVTRTDDIWFLNPRLGWAVNSDGAILKTEDGEHWVEKKKVPAYLRCIAFANANVGWIGSFSRTRRLMRSLDGGAEWTAVSPLPAVPIKICGLAVVSESVVYASGTNEPRDTPGMIKTVDGGQTWTAVDMRPHASILIDTYFTDALHGWVVGGKTDEPNPQNRATIKPVILETSDGGVTWTNRLAGQEGEFAFGEWGWKIQFITPQIGFVSLESFERAAICRTDDGGRTWRRLAVTDGQGNANLEGIGFIDERRGWVGGWGSADFKKGYSSATSDGGATWTVANEIGRFINRFRFFGNPVSVGYASGDTIYKYSSEPIAPRPTALVARDPARELLPDHRVVAASMKVPISMNVPGGTKRLTLEAWDRFGGEVGRLLDEIRPAAGPRVFEWDGTDYGGASVAAGDYIVRLTADDNAASSLVSLGIPAPAARTALRGRATARRIPFVTRPDGGVTVAGLMAEKTPVERDKDWLKRALQVAIQLELATLPPYLTAYWTISDANDPAFEAIHEIWREEMAHFGLACNLLVAISSPGEGPVVTDPSDVSKPRIVPVYPGPLPGGVLPSLEVTLRKLDPDQVKLFMAIEYPQGGPLPGLTALAEDTFDSIGEFYDAILATFRRENPPLDLTRQHLSAGIGVFKIDTLAKVEEAIDQIKRQGEGSRTTPEEMAGDPSDLAHFYRFREIHEEKRFVPNPAGGWHHDPAQPLPFPQVLPMADIPKGGYQRVDVPDAQTWALIQSFDQHYSTMLRLLEDAWLHGNATSLRKAVTEEMRKHMAPIAQQLVVRPRPDGAGNYGPCFRYVP